MEIKYIIEFTLKSIKFIVYAELVVVSCAYPVGKVSRMLFPEGWSSYLRLRREIGQAAHTLYNPQAKCTGVLLCAIRL